MRVEPVQQVELAGIRVRIIRRHASRQAEPARVRDGCARILGPFVELGQTLLGRAGPVHALEVRRTADGALFLQAFPDEHAAGRGQDQMPMVVVAFDAAAGRDDPVEQADAARRVHGVRPVAGRELADGEIAVLPRPVLGEVTPLGFTAHGQHQARAGQADEIAGQDAGVVGEGERAYRGIRLAAERVRAPLDAQRVQDGHVTCVVVQRLQAVAEVEPCVDLLHQTLPRFLSYERSSLRSSRTTLSPSPTSPLKFTS